MERRRRIPVLAAAALAALAALAHGWEHVLVPGQKAFGVIEEAGEVDEIRFFAEAGWLLDFKVKARKGESLLPLVTKLEDPDGFDIVSSLPRKTSRKGNLTRLGKFVAPATGYYLLGISGDASSTGTWDLISKGPSKIPLGAGTVSAPGEEVEHPFEADVGTEAMIQVKAAKGSTLNPLMARLERPEGAGDVDLDAAVRKTSPKKDQVKKLPLVDNGEYVLVVTGASGTTGDYAVLLKIGKKVPLDFSEDPPDGPPPVPSPSVSSVAPPSMARPAAGTEARNVTVSGANFQNGATVAFTPSTGITGVSTTFGGPTSLTVDFTLSSTAATGARTVTVTNPDAKSGMLAAAFTVTASPTLTVASVTPASGPGEGGTRVLVQGTLFEPQATVSFGGVPARAVSFIDPQNLLCTVPPAATLSATAGTAVGVTVDNGAGNSTTLAGAFTYDADPVRPSVLSAVPAAGATGVATNLLKVVLVMTEPVNTTPATMTGNYDFFRSAASGPNDITGPRVTAAAMGPGNRFVVVTRGGATGGTLSTNSIYIAQVHSSGQTTNLLTDVAGNVFDATPFGGPVFQTSFTTGTGTDTVRPTITSTTPAASATGVDVDAAPSILFSEAVDPTTLGGVTLMQGITGIPVDLTLDALCRTLVLTPRTKLAASTTYTIGVSTALRDLSGNALQTAFAASFTTAASDGSAPVQALTVDALPQDMNGSGTYASGTSNGGAQSGSAAPTAFNAYLPRSGFTIDLIFADSGGSGVDPSSFTFTASAAMGGVGAGQNLASQFTVTPLGATWTVPGSHALAAPATVTFTANVNDYAGNAATARVLAVDVADITRTITNGSGTPSTDRDPFNVRQSWLLRFDQDIWTTTASAAGSAINITTSLTSNGTADFREDLVLVGLNGTESGTNASTVTNGSATGTNAIVQMLVKNAVRGWMNRRYGIAYDGTRGADSANIEFLLQGETLAAGGTATNVGWTSSSGYSMMTFTGDERPNASGGTIGRALLDFRNTSQENDSNTGVSNGTNLGTFATHMIRVRINDPSSTLFPKTFDPLISIAGRGGTPVGTSNDDAVVLAGSFNYATATGGQKARYDLIMTAIDRLALYLTATGAHEIGHSTGLVPDGAPPGGLFGNAHPNNTFIASGSFTTSGHIDTPGPNLMEAATSFSDAVSTGSDFMVFGPMNAAYLLRRMIYDQ